jgi:hypothetical protein
LGEALKSAEGEFFQEKSDFFLNTGLPGIQAKVHITNVNQQLK